MRQAIASYTTYFPNSSSITPFFQLKQGLLAQAIQDLTSRFLIRVPIFFFPLWFPVPVSLSPPVSSAQSSSLGFVSQSSSPTSSSLFLQLILFNFSISLTIASLLWFVPATTPIPALIHTSLTHIAYSSFMQTSPCQWKRWDNRKERVSLLNYLHHSSNSYSNSPAHPLNP